MIGAVIFVIWLAGFLVAVGAITRVAVLADCYANSVASAVFYGAPDEPRDETGRAEP